MGGLHPIESDKEEDEAYHAPKKNFKTENT